MATSYLSPGVYIEEVKSSMQSIAGVGTNTVGFIGIVEDEVVVPEFLTDDDYLSQVKAEQDKIYGKDDDYSDAALGAQLAQANRDLTTARGAAPAPATARQISDLTRAVTTATSRLNGLPATATDAEKTAAQNDVAAANAALTAAQAAQQAQAAGGQPAPDAATAAAEKLVADITARQKMSPSDRMRSARIAAREAARASVSRYTLKTFKVNVPVAQAKLCTNFSEFQARFGGWSAYPADAVANPSCDAIPLSGHQILAHGVYDFFNNGGTRCFVVRVRQSSMAADLESALENLESIESISLVAFPGNSADRTVSDALVAHCEKTKYRFAILDAPAAPVDAQNELDLELLTYDTTASLLPGRTKHAAVYFPYIEVIDPALQMQQSNLESIPTKYKGLICAPCSGAVAGIYARVDTQRGVFKAPANETVLGAQNVKYYIGRSAQEGLNPQGVNCIRDINGGKTLWGARTCGGDENAEWRYVNVRRTFLFLAKSIDEGTQWVVFEPNTPTLWGNVRRNVAAFLTTQWRNGALFGNSPEEAFYVKCDAENNPPDSREVGQLVVEVGVSIVRPAEFVIFRITQGTAVAA